MSTSTLLAEKDERDILNPQARPFEYVGKTYMIAPMPDSLLMRIGDAVGEVASVVSGIAELLKEEGASPMSIMVHIPVIVRTLIPCSSQIATIVLGITPAQASAMPLVKRIELLTMILLAEDAPLVLKKLQALMAVFQTEPEAQDEEASSD